MTLLYYYGPIFRIVLGTWEGAPAPKKGKKKRKKRFVIEHEEQVVAIQRMQERLRAIEVAIVRKAQEISTPPVPEQENAKE